MPERWEIERDRIIEEIAIHEEHARRKNKLQDELDGIRRARDLEDLYAGQEEQLEKMRQEIDTERGARWGRR